MTKIAHILSALQEAVTEGAGLPDDDRRALIERSFEQAGGELAKFAPPAHDEMDHVSLMLMQMQAAEAAVEAIEQRRTLAIGGAGASGEAIALAKAWLDLGEVVVAALAAEQAVPVGDNDRGGEGLTLCKVAVGDGEVLVKTALPDSLQGFIVPPEAIADELASIGEGLLRFAGVDLAKFARGEDDDEMEDDRRFAADDEDDGEMDDEPEGGLEGALADIAKLGQMAVLNIAAIKDQLGDEEIGDGEAGALSALDAIAAHGAFMTQQADMLLRAAGGGLGEDEVNDAGEDADNGPGDSQGGEGDAGERDDRDDLERSAPAGGLRKRETTDPRVAKLEEALAKANAALAANEQRLAKLEAQPEPPKAVLNGAGLSLTKQADNGGGEVSKSIDELAEELHKMSPEERTRAIFKLSLNNPQALLKQPGA